MGAHQTMEWTEKYCRKGKIESEICSQNFSQRVALSCSDKRLCFLRELIVRTILHSPAPKKQKQKRRIVEIEAIIFQMSIEKIIF